MWWFYSKITIRQISLQCGQVWRRRSRRPYRTCGRDALTTKLVHHSDNTAPSSYAWLGKPGIFSWEMGAILAFDYVCHGSLACGSVGSACALWRGGYLGDIAILNVESLNDAVGGGKQYLIRVFLTAVGPTSRSSQRKLRIYRSILQI
jgi:hypothetical protein